MLDLRSLIRYNESILKEEREMSKDLTKRMTREQVVTKLAKLDRKFRDLCHWNWDGPEHRPSVSRVPSTAVRLSARMYDIQKRYKNELTGTKYEVDDFPF